MTREKIKKFWSDRAQNTNVPRLESQVNFESDAQIADSRIKAEIELIEKELKLNDTDTIVDLGGRFYLLLECKMLFQ